MPGHIHSVIANPKSKAVFLSPDRNGPRASRCWRSSASIAPRSVKTMPRGRISQSRKIISTTTRGTPSFIQSRKLIVSLASWRTKPIAIMLGGVPTGVPSPPTDAEKAINKIRSARERGRAESWGVVASTPRAIGIITAVVATLLIHMESNAVIPPRAAYKVKGERSTPFRVRSQRASRRSRPCRDIAAAIKKLPINKKIEGEAKGASTSRSRATPRGMQSAGASSAVAAMGIASVIQKTTARASTAARRWASTLTPGTGQISRQTMSKGPNPKPTRCLHQSNRDSASMGSIGGVREKSEFFISEPIGRFIQNTALCFGEAGHTLSVELVQDRIHRFADELIVTQRDWWDFIKNLVW